MDLSIDNMSPIQPLHRFGHTTVAWRGRAWLFGGRTVQAACSNHLYMFDPGHLGQISHCDSVTTQVKQVTQPFWAEVLGVSGSVPSPRDGHAAAVLENAMFVFGGFVSFTHAYDNHVYRLDFHTWSWTHISIHRLPVDIGLPRLLPTNAIGLGTSRNDETHDTEGQAHGPLPRDFTCLVSHQGRLFVFGGRSQCSRRPNSDVYDTALWELVPLDTLVPRHVTTSTKEVVSTHTSVCEVCTPERLTMVAPAHRLQQMAWEEETGNWLHIEPWDTSPPRPCCLWRLLPGCTDQERWHINEADEHQYRQRTCTAVTLRSRWSSGMAAWRLVHCGHGVQVPEYLFTHLFTFSRIGPNCVRVAPTLPSPLGRRSLSHWAYGGHLYFGFGALSAETNESAHIHYNDLWCFNLHLNTWSRLMPSTGQQPHWPVARRRAIACLHWPQPPPPVGYASEHVASRVRPLVYLFGGTQPKVPRYCGHCVNPLYCIRAAPASGDTSAASAGIHTIRTGDILASIGCSAPNDMFITSPVAVCLLHSLSALSPAATLFTLVLVLPSRYPTSTPSHLSTTTSVLPSHLLVISYDELVSLFACSSPLFGNESRTINRLLCNDPHCGLTQLQLLYLLRSVWFGVRQITQTGCVTAPDCYRLQLLLLKQHEPSSDCSERGDMMRPASTNSRFLLPLILKEHSFVLFQHGPLYHECSRCAPNHTHSPTLPSARSTWITVIDLLEECIHRLPRSSSNVNPSTTFAPFAYITSILPSLPECGFVRDVQVWADADVLCKSISVPTPCPESVSTNSGSDVLMTCAETATSWLQRFLLHLRPTLLRLTPTDAFLPSADAPWSMFSLGASSRQNVFDTNHTDPMHLAVNSDSFESSESIDTDMGSAPTETVIVDGVGVLIRGEAKLAELSDFYVMHLDTTLYDMCLRRVHSLHLNPLALLMLLPDSILRDLNQIHVPLVSRYCYSWRQSTSG